MRSAGDDQVVGTRPHPQPAADPPESLAERLERAHRERQRAEHARRATVERERAERDRAARERFERRQREREERLQRELEALRQRRRERPAAQPKRRKPKPAAGPSPTAAEALRAKAQVQPGVKGPVRKRERAAENRRRVARRRRGLFWPTAKAGFATTFVLGISAALGALIGLPVPGLTDSGAGGTSLVNSAAIFGVDAGTPQGLSAGYVFPIIGRYDFGEKIARFGAPRYGHIHEGQDIFAKSGETEVAVHDGVVVDRGTNKDPDSGGRGNYIAIYSPSDDHSFVYMHMLKPSPLGLGQHVHAGDTVGQVGCTGECDGSHLHFEVRIGKASLGADTKPVDPLPYLRQWPQVLPR